MNLIQAWNTAQSEQTLVYMSEDFTEEYEVIKRGSIIGVMQKLMQLGAPESVILGDKWGILC